MSYLGHISSPLKKLLKLSLPMHLAFWNYHLHFKFWHRQRSWHRQSLSMHFSAGHSVIQEVHSVPGNESVSSYLAKEGFPWQGE